MASPESQMILAAFKLISENARVKGKYRVVRLLEQRLEPTEVGPGDLIVSAVPLPPEDLPSQTSNVWVQLHVSWIDNDESTAANSRLAMFDEFDEFRQLLTSNTPLKDGSNNVLSDDLVDVKFLGVEYPNPGQRRGRFWARYMTKIDPTTGDRVG